MIDVRVAGLATARSRIWETSEGPPVGFCCRTAPGLARNVWTLTCWAEAGPTATDHRSAIRATPPRRTLEFDPNRKAIDLSRENTRNVNVLVITGRELCQRLIAFQPL